MDITEKIKFFGELNSAIETLGRAVKVGEALWNDGNVRLTLDDVSDIEAKLRTIKGLAGRLKSINELFNNITNHTIEKVEENN